MHKFGVMGPIDPTVTNEFNPVDTRTNRALGISVEDVKAYVSFIKETVGIKHEEELVRTVEILANKIHPLALGNVERFISQSRMIARKLLTLHTHEDDQHKLDSIIEALASKLYFHGHPINRVEARKELGLSVLENVPVEVETTMWDLFVDFETEMKFRENYDPVNKLAGGVPPNAFIPGQFTELARSDEDLIWAIVESNRLSSRLDQHIRYILMADPQGQHSVNAHPLDQQWSQTESPTPQP